MDEGSISDLDAKIQNLQESYDVLHSQVNFLQKRIRNLETQLRANSKHALRPALNDPDDTKIIQRGNYNLKANTSSISLGNDPKRSAVLSKVNSEIKQVAQTNLETFSEASKSPLEALSPSQHYNLSSNQKQPQNERNFITLSKIPEQEKIEIIQIGFRLNQEGKISLKKYYESTEQYSLFQTNGYSIKYETIRRTKLYQQFKG